MLNIKIRQRIDIPEYRLLYDTKMPLASYSIRNELRTYIRQLRNQWNGSQFPANPLQDKLDNYGNKGGWAKHQALLLDRIVYDANKPLPDGIHGQLRSIEFELIFKNQKHMDEFARDLRKKKLTRVVTIKDDGSLRPDEDDDRGLCKEVCVTYKSGDEFVVTEVCASLKGRAYVNNSCGTHIHFDMRNANESIVKQAGRRLGRCVPALKTLLPKGRRNNQYCATNINDFRSGGGRQSRYSFVNLQAFTKYKTIEIRGHSATLRADKILNWIKICEKIMTSRIRTKTEEVTDPADLIKFYKLDRELSEYVHERYNKFNTPREFPNPGPAVDIPPAPGVIIPVAAQAVVVVPPGTQPPLPARFNGQG